MAAAPPLSVLFPVRNGQETVREALDSILHQSFSDFELLVVDDGSTDDTGEILREAAREDTRIQLISKEPSGIVPALEAARAKARGTFLARMDADDISLPRRFQKQMDLMASDRRIAASGTGVEYVPRESVREGSIRYERWINGLTNHESIEQDLFVECPIPHPTFFLRASALESVGGYRDRGWPEDYDLVLRLWEAGGRFEKVPETLSSLAGGAGPAFPHPPSVFRGRFSTVQGLFPPPHTSQPRSGRRSLGGRTRGEGLCTESSNGKVEPSWPS